MMKINIKHRYLSVFRHFGENYHRENNITRSFLITLCKSAWGLPLFQAFLQMIANKVAEETDAREVAGFLGAPDVLDFDMQQSIVGDDFLPDGVNRGVVVELAPSQPEEVPAPDEPVVAAQAGIVDALLVVEKAEERLAIVVESKLYGRANRSQIETYKEAIRKRTKKEPIEVKLYWDEIVELTDSLPESAKFDPIVADFVDLITEFPGLTGFRGFRGSDFENQWAMDTRMQRLCARLASETVEGFEFAAPERKLGGLDYDLRPYRAGGRVLVGNVGLEGWDWREGRIGTKLVIGARAPEMDFVLARAQDENYLERICEQLEELDRTRRLRFQLGVRLYYTRFRQPWVCIPFGGPNDGGTAPRFRDAVKYAKEYHRPPETTDQLLDSIGERATESETINELKGLAPEQRPRLFSALMFLLEWDKEKLLEKTGPDQVQALRDDLSRLVRLLLAFSERT
jgi:hypothetical protein